MLENVSKIFRYDGSPVTFKKVDRVMINATQMAKHFGKEPKFWLSNQYTAEYLSELSKVRNLTLADLVIVKKGGNNSGTWMNGDVALEFARWLSPKFAIWCNDRIKELMTEGVTTINSEDETIANAIQILQRRLDASNQKVKVLEDENKELAPKAKYTEDVLMSESTYTMTQVAKEFGMSANTFSKLLEQRKIIFRQSGMWMLFAKYDDKGYSAVRTKTIDHGRGSILTSSYLVWTEKGRMFLHAKFDKELNTNNQLEIFG